MSQVRSERPLGKKLPVSGKLPTAQPEGQGEAGAEVGQAQALMDLHIDNVNSVNEFFIPVTIQGTRLLLFSDTGSGDI